MRLSEIKALTDEELNDQLAIMQGGCAHKNVRSGYTSMGEYVIDCAGCGMTSDENPTIKRAVNYITNPADNAQLEEYVIHINGEHAYGQALMGITPQQHGTYRLTPTTVAKVARFSLRHRAEAALMLMMQNYEKALDRTGNSFQALQEGTVTNV